MIPSDKVNEYITMSVMCTAVALTNYTANMPLSDLKMCILSATVLLLVGFVRFIWASQSSAAAPYGGSNVEGRLVSMQVLSC